VARGFEADPAASDGATGARAGPSAERDDLIVGDDGVVYKRMRTGWYKFENDIWTKLDDRPLQGSGKIRMSGVEEEAARRKRARDRFNVFASWQEDM
jgi:hypothetical protein